MGNAQSLGCQIIDSGRKPDRNTPFLRNTQMFDDIKANKCTEYTRDPVTNLITETSWAHPLSITDNNENSNNRQNSSGLLAPQNICFENAQVFGVNPEKNWQNSFAQDFCNNITTADDVDFFKFPQDSNFRNFVFGLDLQNTKISNRTPEWGLPYQAVSSQIKYNITRNELIAAGINIAAILKDILSTKKSAKSGDEDDGDGEADSGEAGAETTETSEGIELTDFASLEDVAEEAGEEIAEVSIEAGIEAFVAAGAATTTASAAASAAAFGPVGIAVAVTVILATIAASFAQDLADSTCGYDDMNKPTSVYQDQKGHPKAACCRNSCAIAGAVTSCVRLGGTGFNASFFQCCLQDFNCHKNKTNNDSFTVSSNEITDNKYDLCFQATNKNTTKIATCHPDARSLNSQICSSVIGSYCTGKTPFGKNQDSVLDAWSANGTIIFENDNGIEFSVKAPCLNFMARLLTGNTSLADKICSWDDFLKENLNLSPEILDPVGLTIAQDILEVFLNEYMNTHGSPIGKINANGYIESSDFLTWFFNLCKDYPFLCQVPLTNFCSGLTPEELLTKPESIQWCGCYLEDKYYTEYDKFSIPKQCSPLCNRINNIPLIGDDGIPVPCSDTICMIDDLAIKLAETFTDGPIDFNQICNTCGGNKVIKKYSSAYQSNQNTNITEFFEIAPLNLDDYNQSYVSGFGDRNTSLVGYDELNSNQTYPIISNTNYNIVKADNSNLSFTVQFNLGIPIVEPGTSKILYYIASLTSETVKDLKNNTSFISNISSSDYSKNIFKITLTDDKTSPWPDNIFYYLRINYYKAGEVKNNNGDTISQSYLQSIVTDVSQYNVGEINKNCTCIVNGNLDFVDEQVSNLSFNNNCGNTNCYDDSGNKIPCGIDSDDINNTNNITNQMIATTSTNVAEFNLLTSSQKTEFISTSVISLFIVVVVANFFLIKFPKKYRIILPAFFFLLLIVIIIIYIIYTDSFGMSNLTSIF